MEFGSINVVPDRSCFVKSDISDVKMRSFDFLKQTKYTTSFISYIHNCYEIIDTEILVKIIPEQFSKIYQQNDVIKEIISFFKIYGIEVDTSPHPTDHFTSVQNAIYKNDDSNFVYKKEDFLKDCESEEDIDFNFTSKNIVQYLGIISMRMQKPIIVLYYTPLGFLRLSSQPLDIETISDSYFFIALGQDVCITPEFTEFSVIHPHPNYGMRKAGLTFFPIIKFELINGCFHPIFNDQSFAHFTTNCTTFATRTDSFAFPYDSLIGRSTILIGLIGVYSKIVKYLSHNAIKVNLVEAFDETSPFIGIYISKAAYLFIFLYIPNNLPPNHPLYRDVTIYTTSLMHRICTRTLYLSEDDSNFEVKSDFHIGGLSKLYNNRILGGFDSSLILHCDLSNCVGNAGQNTIQFNSCDELFRWKKYISRRFQIEAVFSEKVQKEALSFNQVIQLISDHDYSSNKSRIEEVIFGGNNNSPINEIDQLIIQKFKEHSKSGDEESKDALLSACNQKMDQFTSLFNQASHWMKASSFVLSNHCEFCKLPCDEKPDQDSESWSNACPRCKLEKTQNYNRKTRGSKRPTQFLEEKVDEIKQNENDCENIQSLFRSYLSSKEPSEIFAKWLFEYWTIQSLNAGIGQIKTTENIEINDEIKSHYKNVENDDENFSLLSFVNDLTGSQVEDIEYYSILPFIFLQVPIEKDSDSIRDDFLKYYIEKVVPVLCKPPDISPYMFFERCKKEIEIMSQSGFVDDSIVEVSSIHSTKEDGKRIEIEINWKEKNSLKNGKSSNYTFYSISDISIINSSFSSKPMNCTAVVSLHSQPQSLFIVNSFHLSQFNRTVIVTVLGKSLWINVVQNGFNSSFLPNPIFELEVEKDSGKSTFCSFATLANLVVLFVKSKSGDFEFYSIQISRDFESSTIVAHRSFKHMAPLSSNASFSSTMYGFTVSNDATVGVFCSDYHYTPANNDDGEKNGLDFALIRFDPWTLIAKQREDSLDIPFNPIFIVSNSNSNLKLPYDLICHCEKEVSVGFPDNAKLFRVPLDGKRLDEVLGVVLWRGEPRIVKLNEMNEPLFELPEAFRIEAPLSFLPRDAVSIVSDSINKFGLSEADRISANGHYPTDIVTVDSIFDIKNHSKFVSEYFESGKKSASRGIELHLFAHQDPSSFTDESGNSSFSLIDIDLKPKERNDPKKSFWPFFHRITAAPRFLIKSPITPVVRCPSGCTSTILEESFIARKSTFPPLPLIRELIRRGQVECKTFSVVNGFNRSTTGCSDGKDVEILNSYSGMQFMDTPPGSVRLGSSIIPTEFNKMKKFEKFYLLNALSFAPFDASSAAHCALALFHAISCSGAVVFVTRRDVDFVSNVFKMMCESIPAVENSAQHLNFEFSRETETENDENESVTFEPANSIVVVCDLGKQNERETEKLKNEINSLIAGYEPGDICFDILSKDIITIPVDLSSQEISQIIADNVVLPSVDLEAATGRILDFVASYGSFIDNTYLFKFN